MVQNDKEGMQAVVDWLNYTPKDFNSIAPHILNTADPPSRKGRFVLRILSPPSLIDRTRIRVPLPCITVPHLTPQ